MKKLTDKIPDRDSPEFWLFLALIGLSTSLILTIAILVLQLMIVFN